MLQVASLGGFKYKDCASGNVCNGLTAFEGTVSYLADFFKSSGEEQRGNFFNISTYLISKIQITYSFGKTINDSDIAYLWIIYYCNFIQKIKTMGVHGGSTGVILEGNTPPPCRSDRGAQGG